jgi:hypothetical protein
VTATGLLFQPLVGVGDSLAVVVGGVVSENGSSITRRTLPTLALYARA